MAYTPDCCKAGYIVNVADPATPNAFVLTNSASITWDFSVPGIVVGNSTSTSTGPINWTEAGSVVAPNNLTGAVVWRAVSTLADSDAAIEPKGTGAFLLQIPDSTIAGGNKRGPYAVDLQRSRSATTQVAAAYYSVIVGGYSNQASNTYSVIVGGNSNLNQGTTAFIGGGEANFISLAGTSSTIGGGTANTIAASYGAIGGGYGNSAYGSFSTIGGGYLNVTNNSMAAIAGGSTNSNYGVAAFIGAGSSNSITSSGNNSAIGGGSNNYSGSINSAIGGGADNLVSSTYGTIPGGRGASTRTTDGMQAWSGESGFVAGIGQADSQEGKYLLKVEMLGATPVRLSTNRGAVSAYNQITLPNNSTFVFAGEVVVRDAATGNSSSWRIEGMIRRGVGAASTVIVGTPAINIIDFDAGASAWSLGLSADTTLGCLAITISAAVGVTVRAVARINTTELVY